MMEVIEDEEVLDETDVAEKSRSCERSFICADEEEVLRRLLKGAVGSAA